MIILPYEHDQLENQDIVQDFCKRISVDYSAFNFETPKRETHASLDRRYMAVKKHLNRKQRTKTEERVMIECLDKLNARLPRIEKYQIDNSLIEKLEKHSNPHHKWMSEQYGQNKQPFFQKKKQPSEKQRALTDKEFQDAMEEFEFLYKSRSMKMLRLRTGIKSFLRNNHPTIYAFVKNMASR